MKVIRPAEVRSEPASVSGVPFIEAAGKLCLWPLGGSGAEMVCCGERRTIGSVYCLPHLERAEPGRFKRG